MNYFGMEEDSSLAGVVLSSFALVLDFEFEV